MKLYAITLTVVGIITAVLALIFAPFSYGQVGL